MFKHHAKTHFLFDGLIHVNNKILWTVKTDILNIKYNEPFGTLLEDQQSETFIESKIKCKQVAYEVYYTKNQNLGLFFHKKLYFGTRWWN